MKLKIYSIKLINFYQKTVAVPINKFLEYFGLFRNNSFVFYPTCSEYTKEAVRRYGILEGFFLGFRRILRCHPWQKNHIDLLK